MHNRLPSWFKQDIPNNTTLEIVQLLSELKVNTVCKEARCPNITECFNKHNLTFMILGSRCTRSCKFCCVQKDKQEILSLDKNEPYRISQLVKRWGLKYVVITSVTRDDLFDGGAGVFAQTTKLIKKIDGDVKIELLIPDFGLNLSSLRCVLDAGPYIVGHNIETVRSLYKILRPEANYDNALKVLRTIKEMNPEVFTKSSIMLGLGEKRDEVIETMSDLKENSCDILTLGQYLSPSKDHYPVKEFVSLEEFDNYRQEAIFMGFKAVSSGPKVRSSYYTERLA